MLTKGGQPEILRAAQRDEAFQKQLNDSLSEILHVGFGVQVWMKYRELSRILSNIVYQLLTTFSNLQTLGEEYTGIVQVTSSTKSLPSKPAQLVMILLDTLGDKMCVELLNRFEKHVQNLPQDHPLLPEARSQLIKASSVLKQSIPFIQRVHKAVFYLKGDCYQISKRSTGIRYALVRHWLRDRSSLPTFRLLGIISFIHLLVHALLALYKSVPSPSTQAPPTTTPSLDAPPRERCSLCLAARRRSTVTPCGHLFCWDCIIPWLQTQPFCPLCRQKTAPSRVVSLQNYRDEL